MKNDDITLKPPKTGVFANNRIICKCRCALLKEIILHRFYLRGKFLKSLEEKVLQVI